MILNNVVINQNFLFSQVFMDLMARRYRFDQAVNKLEFIINNYNELKKIGKKTCPSYTSTQVRCKHLTEHLFD